MYLVAIESDHGWVFINHDKRIQYLVSVPQNGTQFELEAASKMTEGATYVFVVHAETVIKYHEEDEKTYSKYLNGQLKRHQRNKKIAEHLA